MFEKGKLELKNCNVTSAVNLFLFSFEKDKTYECALMIGNVYSSLNQMSQAINYYNKAIKIEKEKSSEENVPGDPFYYIANCNFGLKKYAEALKYLSIALGQFQKQNQNIFAEKHFDKCVEIKHDKSKLANDIFKKYQKEYIRDKNEKAKYGKQPIIKSTTEKESDDKKDCVSYCKAYKKNLLNERKEVYRHLNNRYFIDY